MGLDDKRAKSVCMGGTCLYAGEDNGIKEPALSDLRYNIKLIFKLYRTAPLSNGHLVYSHGNQERAGLIKGKVLGEHHNHRRV